MPRRRRRRWVEFPPIFWGFKPWGFINPQIREEVNLSLDEYEAIRLVDYLGLKHEDAAEKMNISRPTFTRILEDAHKKIADAIINGKELLIKGGDVEIKNKRYVCLDCNKIIEENELDSHRYDNIYEIGNFYRGFGPPFGRWGKGRFKKW